MDRRRFLKTAAGLFVPAIPAIIRPDKARAQGGMGPGPGTVHSTGGGGLGLQTSCTGFWSFETGSWTDDTASATTLTATGSPTSTNTAPALVGNYLALPGSAYLTAASNSNIVTAGGSFSVQMWIYSPGSPGSVAFGKGTSGFGNAEWSLGSRFSGSNKWSFFHYDSSSNVTNADDSASITNNVWVHLVATYDSATKGLTLYKNGASVGTATATNAVQSTTNEISIGRGAFGGAGVATGYRFDQCGFWKGRILSAGDVTSLYNSGAGLSWAGML
ncbi:LamG domain-containing protein [Azospirillum sp.]|uniref:LamG domain-containing protein n=1 Tax=Azospirillum sp. TaxID=34012 RepID=UPI002D536D21|nr:LamG domain-containing protein [Azospirillum sp.]HYD66181.1 LamG domain-containing protein [Azospirillum sp.]